VALEVAAAVIQRADGSFLRARRPAGKVYAGFWEFPGGKIEPGEAAERALETIAPAGSTRWTGHWLLARLEPGAARVAGNAELLAQARALAARVR